MSLVAEADKISIISKNVLTIISKTVTFFWVLSDFLSSKTQSLAITEDLLQESSDAALVEMAANPDHPAADAALWMLLLLRLTTVTADNRLELRNSKRCQLNEQWVFS